MSPTDVPEVHLLRNLFQRFLFSTAVEIPHLREYLLISGSTASHEFNGLGVDYTRVPKNLPRKLDCHRSILQFASIKWQPLFFSEHVCGMVQPSA